MALNFNSFEIQCIICDIQNDILESLTCFKTKMKKKILNLSKFTYS